MYKLEIDYIRNALNPVIYSEMVDCTWVNFRIAKMALDYIVAHDKAVYKSNLTGEYSEYENEPWFVSNSNCEYWKEYILLPLDDGSYTNVCTFWEGYFEILKGVKIKISIDKETSCNAIRLSVQ